MNSHKVLVIEDDFDIPESMVDLLLTNGLEACSAKDGRDGLLELRIQSDVSVILLDLSMPMMDGKAFRTEQLADPELSAIPLIVLSAEANITQLANELGALAKLSKPFVPEALIEAIRAVASRS